MWARILIIVGGLSIIAIGYLNIRLEYEKRSRKVAENAVNSLTLSVEKLKKLAESEEEITTNEKIIIREIRNAPQKQYKAPIEPVLDNALDNIERLHQEYTAPASSD